MKEILNKLNFLSWRGTATDLLSFLKSYLCPKCAKKPLLEKLYPKTVQILKVLFWEMLFKTEVRGGFSSCLCLLVALWLQISYLTFWYLSCIFRNITMIIVYISQTFLRIKWINFYRVLRITTDTHIFDVTIIIIWPIINMPSAYYLDID